MQLKLIQKAEEATGDLIGNKIDKFKGDSKNLQQN